VPDSNGHEYFLSPVPAGFVQRCPQAKQPGLASIGCRGVIRTPEWLLCAAR